MRTPVANPAAFWEADTHTRSMEDSEPPRVGVVGDAAIASTVEGAGASTTRGDAATVLAADPEWIVAHGEEALADLVAEGGDVAVLVVGDSLGVPAVSRSRAAEAVDAVLDGSATRTSRRVFTAAVGGEQVTTMLRDAMLITDEPARISEYAVRTGGDEVARFRADGVVVASPAGSQGYLAAAGGPIVEPGTGTLAAVPVAPFQTDSDHWVLDDAAVSLTVHRDEPVTLVVDGRETVTVPQGAPVALAPRGELPLIAVDGDWKNSNGRRTE